MRSDAEAREQEQAGADEPAPAITSRFLFVDVSAQRAKQLRRGARARLSTSGPHKLERVAMEEVRHGLVEYTLPPGFDGAGAERTR